ncbi:MAG: choice-of-anchor Q domain-containing protein [Terriglobia bacterium]
MKRCKISRSLHFLALVVLLTPTLQACEFLDIVFGALGRLAMLCDRPSIFIVTRQDDPPTGNCTETDCSLRQAIALSNACPRVQTVSLPAGDYLVTIAGVGEDSNRTGDLDITSSVNIVGDGDPVIDGAGIDRVFQIIGAGTSVSMSDLTITGGDTPGNGGGILNDGSLRLNNVSVQGNTAGSGGGAYNGYNLTLTSSNVSDNSSLQGGGIFNSHNLAVSMSTFTGNNATGDAGSGGGIANLQPGNLSVRDSSFAENSAVVWGGGVFNECNATIRRSTFTANFGSASGTAINNQSVADCSGLSLLNATISGNRGVAINAYGQYKIENTTIAHNLSVGVNLGTTLNPPGVPEFVIHNSIIANNGSRDCVGPITHSSSGNNLDSDGSCGFSTTGDLSGVDPRLDSLGNWGGQTQTHRLLEGSPAIDAAGSPCPSEDQRGVARPIGGGCDIGAYEYDFAVIAGTPDIVPIFTPTATSTVNTTALCWKGPGTQYDGVSSLQSGTEVTVLGIGAVEGWFVVHNPRYNVPCWFDANYLDVGPSLDLDTLQIFPVPPLPTATPTLAVAPNAPSGVDANTTVCNGGYQVTITWNDNSNNEQGFRVYRNGSLIATLGPNVEVFVDNPGGSGPYTYYVVAFNSSGQAQSNSDDDSGCVI